jgi:hypothetical protein
LWHVANGFRTGYCPHRDLALADAPWPRAGMMLHIFIESLMYFQEKYYLCI